MACYDEKHQLVRTSKLTTMSIVGAKYIRLTVSGTDLNTFQCEYGTKSTSYEPYTVKIESLKIKSLESVNSRWKNKNVLVLGDSISTKMYLGYDSWAEKWAEKVGAKLTNPSVHAVGFLCSPDSQTPNANSLINLIDTLHESYPNRDDFDLIIFFRGTNDWGNSIPLGKTGDAKESSFIGAVEYCFSKAIEYWSKSRITAFTPMQRRTQQLPNSVGLTLSSYANTIKEKANCMSFPVLDLYNESGFSQLKIHLDNTQQGVTTFVSNIAFHLVENQMVYIRMSYLHQRDLFQR